MRNYNSVDVMKFVAAILVVAIHTNPFLSVWDSANVFFVDGLARLAVPLFFMASGFFLSNKLSGEGSFHKVLNYIKHIAILYVVWSVIYLPINIYNWAVTYQFQMDYWLLYMQSFFFEGSYYILWFFPALIFGTVMLWLFYDAVPKALLLPVCILLYFAGSMGQPYYDRFIVTSPIVESYYRIFLTTRNGLFFAFPFMCLGAYARKHMQSIEKNRCLIYAVLSFAFLIAEVFLAKDLPFTKGSGMWLFVLPTTFFLFIFITKIKLADDARYFILRKMSTLIYLCHGLFVTAFAIISPRLGIHNSVFEFFFVLVPSLGLSYIILKLSTEYDFELLRLLYE